MSKKNYALNDESIMTHLEQKICELYKSFEENYWGKKSLMVKVYQVEDLVIIRSQGGLSPAEEQLAKTEEGRILIKQLKIKELSGIKNVLKFMLENNLKKQILSLTIDNNPELNETIIILTFEEVL